MNILNNSEKLILAPKSFFFIRHGETEHNARDLCAGGTVDSPLTKRGVNQAQLLGQRLQEKTFGPVFSSTLQRAKNTAQLVTNCNPLINHDLREWDLGWFEETPVERFITHVKNPNFDGEVPGGESRPNFFNRSINAINMILNEHENPVIVAHGGTYWALLDALGLPNEHINNCGCVFFEFSNGLWKRTEI